MVKVTRIVECMREGCWSDQRGVRRVSLRVLCSLPREVVTADRDSEIDHDHFELRIGVQLAQRKLARRVIAEGFVGMIRAIE